MVLGGVVGVGRKESGDEGHFGSSAGCSPSPLPPPPPLQAASAGLNPLGSSDHGQVSLGYEASSGLPLLFPSWVEWGASPTPQWEGCSLQVGLATRSHVDSIHERELFIVVCPFGALRRTVLPVRA